MRHYTERGPGRTIDKLQIVQKTGRQGGSGRERCRIFQRLCGRDRSAQTKCAAHATRKSDRSPCALQNRKRPGQAATGHEPAALTQS